MGATVLVIGVGNPTRGDDGVGPRVVELLAGSAGLELLVAHGFVPELAAEVAGHARVVFVDADPGTAVVALEAVGAPEGSSAVAHGLGPGAIVALARRLYDFTGEAWVCRVPARDLSVREGLSDAGELAALEAARAVAAMAGERWAAERG